MGASVLRMVAGMMREPWILGVFYLVAFMFAGWLAFVST